jgi:hypothetical protein
LVSASAVRAGQTHQEGLVSRTAADVLTIEVAKQRANGKLIVYATSSDPKVTLSITVQLIDLPAPIDLLHQPRLSGGRLLSAQGFAGRRIRRV